MCWDQCGKVLDAWWDNGVWMDVVGKAVVGVVAGDMGVSGVDVGKSVVDVSQMVEKELRWDTLQGSE